VREVKNISVQMTMTTKLLLLGYGQFKEVLLYFQPHKPLTPNSTASKSH
jgi:hypothetical protein